MNAIEWALGILEKMKFPPELWREAEWRLSELRRLSREELTDYMHYCPAPGCTYKCILPAEANLSTVVCPVHQSSLSRISWKRACHESEGAMRGMLKELRNLEQRLDDVQFLAANESSELEYSRMILGSPYVRFAQLMEHEIIWNSHKGDWDQWAPSEEELWKEIGHHLKKLCAALRKRNKGAVTEFAADIGNYMNKTVQMYGSQS